MLFQLVRHATIKIRFNDFTFLVDPMLGSKGTMAPVANAANEFKNPLVDLPLSVGEVVSDLDAIILTHSHRDHFDDSALELIPRHIPIFCQPEDVEKLQNLKFTKINMVEQEVDWNGIHLTRTGGQHGTGELGKQMGAVSGFILESDGEPIVYIAGDTVWCDEVEEAIKLYSPNIIILNGGEAQYLTGDPITMGCADIHRVSQTSLSSKIIVVHMESWNHCLLTRESLQKYIDSNQLHNVFIPNDGTRVEFNNKGHYNLPFLDF
jgi:L-ascorbate metabolism protein UlaG (beta-lactamase superfamily)